MKKILFIDRDGTILVEPEDEQIDSFDKMEFVPGAIVNLHRIANELDFELVLVSNQDGLGTPSFPEETFWPVQDKMLLTLKNEGVHFSDILIDRSLPQENAETRKPGTAMLKKYLQGDYDLEHSYVIGDRLSDLKLAQNLGAGAILLNAEENFQAALVTQDWHKIFQFLNHPQRKISLNRKTKETNIHLRCNLDGRGLAEISTGIGFFDHMLDLFAKHSQIDLKLLVKGDLHVDEHHTLEDTALVLGQAINEALGDKKGLQRYGFLLPMDESIAEVAIDFSGRPWLNWNVEFKREYVGQVPTEMFYHFFKSFCDSAKCNLYIKAAGGNEHHKIEAIFKAVSHALKIAIKRDPRSKEIPSSKGSL